MASKRGKCIFNDALAKTYPFRVRAKDKTPSDVRCILCNSVFSIANGGKTDIEKHLTREKHQKAEQVKSISTPITGFLPRINQENAAREGVWAYHVVQANNSFMSTDCASKLFRECFGMKDFHCARTKTEAIITNVFAPLSESMLKKELLECHFVTLTADASNHGNTKMMPVLARYFLPTIGVRVKMIEFTSIKNETSETITNVLMEAAEQNNIKEKFVGFCGDNCPTNFGSVDRGGDKNVFYKLKQLKPSMIGIGCAAHIVHNAMKYTCGQLPIDIECIVVKIYKHFHINTVRIEALKCICESFDDINFAQLLGYANTRFLALGPAIDRISTLFEPLKQYFLELSTCPKKIKEFFNSPLSKCLLLFVKDQVNFHYFRHLQILNICCY